MLKCDCIFFGRDCFTVLLTVGPFGIYWCRVDRQATI